MENKETLNLAIIANSNKRHPDGYGRCIAAISQTGEWVRLVEDKNGNSIPEDKAKELPVGTVIQAEIERVPLKNQSENAILLNYNCVQDDITQYIHNVKSVDEEGIFGNKSEKLSETEIKRGMGTLRYINVEKLSTYWSEGKDSKCKTKFVYQGNQYNDIAMTDPKNYPNKGKTKDIGDAHIVVSLPDKPPFYKFVADIDPNGKTNK